MHGVSIQGLLLITLLIFSFFNVAYADTDAENIYNKSGIKLSYPKNWSITDDQTSKKFSMIVVESEDGKSITAHILKNNRIKSLTAYAKLASKKLVYSLRQTFNEEKSLRNAKIEYPIKFIKSAIDFNKKKYPVVIAKTNVIVNGVKFAANKVYYFKFKKGNTDAFLTIGGMNEVQEQLESRVKATLARFKFKDRKW